MITAIQNWLFPKVGGYNAQAGMRQLNSLVRFRLPQRFTTMRGTESTLVVLEGIRPFVWMERNSCSGASILLRILSLVQAVNLVRSIVLVRSCTAAHMLDSCISTAPVRF